VPSSIPFETFAQSVPNQVWSATPDGQLDWFNQSVFKYSGYGYEDLAGSNWARMVHPEDIEKAAATWTEALSSGASYETEFRLRRADGQFRWHLARATPIKNDNGAITRWVGTNTDIHDRKTAEQQQQLLLLELEHRIKNTMALVEAIVGQTFRTASSKEDAESIIGGRLRALSHAHDALIHVNWSRTDIASVVNKALEPHRKGEGRIWISGAQTEISSRRALTLVLALHELATNAVKYGALSVPSGKVEITWKVLHANGSETLQFVWKETGGPTVTAPTKRGFGSRLIESTLKADFGENARIEYLSDGVRCSFEARLDDAQ